MKIVRDLVISSKEPKNTNVGWLKPTTSGNYTLNFHNRGIWNDIVNKQDSKIIRITYKELVNLRDTSKLIEGCYYRITDFVTTTSEYNTKSAGHYFDLIVLAKSNNSLYEEAMAEMPSNGDTYFAQSNLNAWKIWYCIDNNKNRFYWATPNGKGVIYRMIDEFNNDVPYDFKNIMFYNDFQLTKGYFYTFSKDLSNNVLDSSLYRDYNIFNNSIKPCIMYYRTLQFLNYNIFLYTSCYNNSLGYNCNYNIIQGNYNSFGKGCSLINFYYRKQVRYANNSFGNNCTYIDFDTVENIHMENQICNYKFTSNVNGYYGKNLEIIGTNDRNFVTTVSLNSSGQLVEYCEADLIYIPKPEPEPKPYTDFMMIGEI